MRYQRQLALPWSHCGNSAGQNRQMLLHVAFGHARRGSKMHCATPLLDFHDTAVLFQLYLFSFYGAVTVIELLLISNLFAVPFTLL